jgi:hypothetical protein
MHLIQCASVAIHGQMMIKSFGISGDCDSHAGTVAVDPIHSAVVSAITASCGWILRSRISAVDERVSHGYPCNSIKQYGNDVQGCDMWHEQRDSRKQNSLQNCALQRTPLPFQQRTLDFDLMSIIMISIPL